MRVQSAVDEQAVATERTPMVGAELRPPNLIDPLAGTGIHVLTPAGRRLVVSSASPTRGGAR